LTEQASHALSNAAEQGGKLINDLDSALADFAEDGDDAAPGANTPTASDEDGHIDDDALPLPDPKPAETDGTAAIEEPVSKRSREDSSGAPGHSDVDSRLQETLGRVMQQLNET